MGGAAISSLLSAASALLGSRYGVDVRYPARRRSLTLSVESSEILSIQQEQIGNQGEIHRLSRKIPKEILKNCGSSLLNVAKVHINH